MTLSRNALGLWAMLGLGVILVFGVPHLVEPFALIDLTLFISMAILSLSLAFVWGFGGILCFGQSAFFGLGAYTYAVAVINMGDSTVPILLGILLPVLLALVLGYFMFYGRVSDVYLAVITLAVSLVFYYLIGASAGSEYRIGKALLGGYNGIPSVPPINVPGNPSAPIEYEMLYAPAAGTTVTVRLPTTAAPATAARRPRRVLLAETEPLLRMQLSREIAKEGHVVESADSGPDALAKLQDEPFDCVFVDVAIPLTPQARQVIDLAKARGARVIVLLGWGDEITEDALRAHDIDGVLRKPFPPASILSLIAGCET